MVDLRRKVDPEPGVADPRRKVAMEHSVVDLRKKVDPEPGVADPRRKVDKAGMIAATARMSTDIADRL